MSDTAVLSVHTLHLMDIDSRHSRVLVLNWQSIAVKNVNVSHNPVRHQHS